MKNSRKYSVVQRGDDEDQDFELQTKLAELNNFASVDFETALAKAGYGKFNYIMLLIAIPASCTNAFVQGTMSYVIPVAGPDLGLTPITKAILLSAPHAGMILSGLFWGVLSDSFGRQRLIAAGFLLDFIMNTFCALIPYLPSMILFKFLSGVMVCGPYSIFMAYISEVFLKKKRDIAVLSSGIFCSILMIVHVCLGYLVIPAQPPDWLPFKSWQLFIFICGIPALISGLACTFTVESPKFLAEKGKTEKALEVCKSIFRLNSGLTHDSFPVKNIRKPLGFRNTPKKIPFSEKLRGSIAILKPPYIYRMLMIFGLQVAVGMTVNMIILWLPEMLTVIASVEKTNQTSTLCPLLVAGHKAQAAGSHVVPRQNVYNDMLILNACGFVAQLIFIIAVRYIEKKIIIMAVASIAVCCTISIPNINSEYIFIPASITVAVVALAFFSTIGINIEIFPTRIRATSVSMTMLVGRIGVMSVNFVVAKLMYTYCEYMFYLPTFLCIGIIIICVFLDTTPFEGVPRKVTRIRHETL